jgi:hypothetical protein
MITKEQLLIAHLERLTELVNFALDNCLIEDDPIINALDKELETVRGLK